MAKLTKGSGETLPSIMTIQQVDDDVTYASINLNIVPLTDGTYVWDKLELPDFALNNIHNADDETKYSVLIAHIVKAYYNDNQMTAIINNYLLDPEDEAFKNDFNKMQSIRILAKKTAKDIVTNKIF
jgi:hypothetical protein